MSKYTIIIVFLISNFFFGNIVFAEDNYATPIAGKCNPDAPYLSKDETRCYKKNPQQSSVERIKETFSSDCSQKTYDDCENYEEVKKFNLGKGTMQKTCTTVCTCEKRKVNTYRNICESSAKIIIELTEPIAGTGIIEGDDGLDLLIDYISKIYVIGASLIGIIAVFIIAVSGIQISLGGIMPDGINQSKERIFQALLSLLLLFSSALILHTINPGFFT